MIRVLLVTLALVLVWAFGFVVGSYHQYWYTLAWLARTHCRLCGSVALDRSPNDL